jgi:hypothetical protein
MRFDRGATSRGVSFYDVGRAEIARALSHIPRCYFRSRIASRSVSRVASHRKEWERLAAEYRAARAEFGAANAVVMPAYRADGLKSLPPTVAHLYREDAARINLAATKRRLDDFLQLHPNAQYDD